ncbi:non-ribosomal peptide synthase/polyketide synthase [Pyxidicoccus fallax]|uniref:Non-ribosomal peptide synthase/polyketide synthase n=1 Tax=Pyxidicoccus fallax TaxID=394095 RepID=A0A848L6F6_9BACT|nr:non-ribosomal peptide synthase/polyketide synthase [Pyxidicoccus fallax]NMO14244.1 non-ribosomal peptide synthase/polyketide synthase [Pyxidicoccus fallax]NPC78192.1 non-ribosomal peptide synthase/polyketide synthase [Pyxidicoccus fallax]
MSGGSKHLDKLSPKQRALYEFLLKEKRAQLREAARRRQGRTIPKREDTGSALASFSQQRLWVVEQLEEGRSSAYNVHTSVRFTGTLDIPLLERCVNQVVKRHESLRTVFAANSDGTPVQVVLPELRVPVPVEDLSRLSKDEQDAEVVRRTREESQRLFDLTRGPLIRGKVLRLGPGHHVALVTIHHLVTDLWSMGVFVRELMTLYAGEVTHQPAVLPPLPIQYSDYAVWQGTRLRGERLRVELEFWTEHLTPLPPPLELPTDKPRPPVQTARGAREYLTLSVPLTRALKQVSQQEGATLFMTLLSAFQALLHRYSGQTDFAVGTPIAGRVVPELEPLIGYFVNTLVLRTPLDGAPTFRELLRRAKDVCLAAYAHQELPLERLVEELRPERDLSRHPIFQVMFGFQNTPLPDLSLPKLRSQYLPVDPGSAKFDLLLELREDPPDEISGWLEYNTDLFEAESIQRLRGHFLTLLGAAAANPDQRLSELSLLPSEEQLRLLMAGSGPRAEFPRDVPMHALFARHAARAPHSVAVEHEGQSLTYAELDARSNQLARHLLSLGLKPEARVGLCVERGLDLVVGLLGILKAGGCYVPLDPAYPRQRLAFMFEDSGVAVVLTQQPLRASLPPHSLPTVCLDSDWPVISREPAEAPADVRVSPDQLAYVLYTSGSTGTPKGVAISHRSIVHLVRDTNYVDLRPDDCMVQVGTPSFDAATFELWGALLNGARLVIIPRDVSLAPEHLARRLAEVKATCALLTTALFNQVAHEQPSAFSAMRHVFFGGEKADPRAVRAVLEAGGPGRLVNLYGPTEVTVCATFQALESLPAGATSVPIGGPLSRMRLYVLDAHGRPVPPGVPGELYIGGDGLARGYLGRPDLTAERFVPDPFSGEAGARLYRTGDTVRWSAEGTLVFVGRVDAQVKVRGFRIEPGEVEAALRQHASVQEAVVLVREDVPGDARLVAYCVPAAPLEVSALRAFLSERLPPHAVPSAFVSLSALPLTPGGKVDRKSLPPPAVSSVAATSGPEAMTATQQRIATLFRELLNVEHVGPHDDFFALGGHSLLATRIVSRLRATFGVELPLRTVFAAPTAARLTEQVEARLHVQGTESGTPALRPVAREGDLPLSFAQQRLWVVDQLQPGSSNYNIGAALQLEGVLDVAALRRALEHLVARHEALRATFALKAGQPVQVIHPHAPWNLPLTDLGTLSPEAREAEARRLATEESTRPFDLATGPLLRTRLLRVGPEQHVLVLVMHHIVSDGWSVGVMIREVVAGYEAFASGKAPVLPPLPVQYVDFAAWQRQWLQGDVLAREVAWWKEQLAGAPPVLDLPVDKPRPSIRSPRGALVPVHLGLELSERLVSLARQEGATPFMVLLAAWQVVLSRYSGQEELLVASFIAGRRQEELEGLVGFFVNTLVLRGRIRPRDSFRELLAGVRDTTLAAFEHQDVPFEKLVEELNVPRDLSRNPLVQVLFTLQNAPGGELKAPGLTLRPLELEHTTAQFDLNLALAESPDGLEGTLEYSTDLFETATVTRMAGHLRTLLEAAVATPERPLGALEMLTPEERHQVLVEWNGVTADYPRDAFLHTLFEQQVDRTPDAPAVVLGEQTLSFRELNARANQLAHHLRALGVGPEVRVGLCLERTPDAIVALMAVWKAGGAFVPLDPSAPVQRRSFVMQDSGASVLLTVQHLADAWRPEVLHLVCLDAEGARLASLPDENLPVVSGGDHLAYVMYTSGSTGTPKGVMVRNGALVNLREGTARALYAGLTGPLRISINAPFFFDISMEQFLHVVDGHCLCLLPEMTRKDPEALLAWIERHRVDVLDGTPAQLTLLLQAGMLERPHVPKLVVSGGEAMDLALWTPLSRTGRTRTVNAYGPTEATVYATTWCVQDSSVSVPVIGRPMVNTWCYVLDDQFRLVPPGVPGELYLAGDGVARGYLGRPALTAERFVPDPFGTEPGARMYRTGDRARWRADGSVEYLGRLDFQVKVRGFRIELGEIETALQAHPAVTDAVVLAREDVPGDKRLVAYVVAAPGSVMDTAALRAHLHQRVPEYMVPSVFVSLPTLPLTPNGKVDRRALPAPTAAASERQGRFEEPARPLEQQLAAIYARELGAERVGVHDHLFEELGGTSLSVVRIATRLREELKRDVPVVWLFEHPTIHALAQHLEREAGGAAAPVPGSRVLPSMGARSGAVAIIGMAGRFPGAASVEEFWRNLREGVESISRFSPEELEHLPELPEGLDLWQHPAFVPAGGVLEGIDRFDHPFFDLSLREAQWMDPQQRLFLQTAWSALEDAGIDPGRAPGDISLYAGAVDSGYADMVRKTLPLDGASHFELNGTATHESLATKTSFKLGLTGESSLVYTACSTGLVAVHMACKDLLAGMSDVALAGATRITVPQRTGYVWQEGMILSPDGHCRAFDAQARGTIAGSAVAAVVLKRLEDAQRDGDSIYAVIRATATNNDGHGKSGFTAPSVQGQTTVITRALARAGVEPKDIGYVEAHGTGTPLGDPIEVTALQRAYGLGEEHRGTIALASLKTNVGHLDTVAGLAGLIKVALSLHHGEIPPSLHFERPNPQIDFGPFFVNTALRPWPRGGKPRRAAVSSFGIGGTNAHAVLEEAPVPRSDESVRARQLVVLSARSPEALETASHQLATHVENRAAELSLSDTAFTQAMGRKAFEYRRAVVAADATELAKQLRKPYTPVRVKEEARRRRVAFVFPGQGAQQVGMGRELYEAEPAFRTHLDACLALLDAPLRARVRVLLQAAPGAKDAETAALLADTRVALPALFSVEYSLARTWMDWGLKPHAILGHSFGEYAAACLAGVLPLEDALKLAVARGELMHRMPPGAMLAVAMSESVVLPMLTGRLEMAAINAPDRCVVAGPVDEVERFQEELKRRDIGAVRMPAPHAFHSADVAPLMPELERVVASLRRSEPTVRYASSVTGTWAKPGALAEPRYWADQMRQPVRFSEAVGALLEEGCSLVLEVGPGQDLTPLVRSCLGQDRERVKALATLRRGGNVTEHGGFLQAVGELWTLGVEVDWSAFYAHEQRRRLHLPTYPFQEKHCWVDAEPAPVVGGHVVHGGMGGTPAGYAPTSVQAAVSARHPAPSVTEGSAGARDGADAPLGDIEARVAAIWRERLGLDFVGRDDNFLEIGGNSLMAAQLLNQLRDTFGVQLPLSALFESPTVAGIAHHLEPLLRRPTEEEHRRPLPEHPEIPRAPKGEPLPLSFAQQRLWYLQQLDPSSVAYNNAPTFRMRGALNPAALQGALDALVRRHEVLRTTYTLTENGAVQVIHPDGGLPMPVEDVPGATPEEREAAMLRRCQEHTTRPFDLERGPVARALLLRLGVEEYVLSLVLHHAVSDGWCALVIGQELPVLYASFVAGQPSPLPELPVQYADFAVWQRQYLEGAVLDGQLGWWKEQLAGVPALELPTDRPRPAVQSSEGDIHRFDWPRELSAPLLALGRREGATPFMVMLALYQVLLGRYAGQEDFAIGTPIAGRTRPEVEGLIGCFVNTLAFRSRLPGASTFRELVGHVRKQALEGYARQDAPFERLIEVLQVPRDLSRSPVFQVMLNVLNTPEADPGHQPVDLSIVEVPTGTAKFDLGLEVWERQDEMSFRLEYSTKLFDRSTVERLTRHLAVLARAVAASPDLPLRLLPLLTEEERRQVLVEWNDTASDYPREACIHHLFEQQAVLRPDSVALEFGDTRLTYAQLDTRANQLAHLMRRNGVGPDALVAVCLERSVELIVSLLAILKAGGAYVPLDASYPAQRLAFMLEDAPPRLLVTSREVRARMPVAEDVPCLYVEELSLDGLPTSAPAVQVEPRHLAYVDFTSGSTGRPKGVAVEHRGVMRLLHGAKYAHLGPEETFLLIAPISFDASTLEVWGPLLFGGRLVVFPPRSPSDLELLAKVLKRHAVTTLHLTSGLFSQVVDLEPEALRAVRQLLTGGDVVSAPHVRRVVEELGIAVTACYGPTESTLFTSTYRMTDAAHVGTSIPIGTPIANTRVYVLDEHLRPVPPGIPGELFIGGDGLARGYLSRPDLTAERFIPHPFGDGERLYRTGDKARWRSDGVLEFLGRIDNQVKVRGYRIELAEVEAALLTHPGVREAVAVVRQDSPGDKRLVAYVTGDAGPLDATELRAHVQSKLPEYMVPSAVVHLGALPLTTHGKVDRKALPAPDVQVTKRGQYVAPRTPAETTLTGIFAQVLGVSRVGVHDNFFELGGHSLLATQVIARVRAAFRTELPLRALFEAPTAATLAERLQAPTATRVPTLVRADRSSAIPLSFSQQRLWFLDQLHPGQALYNIPLALRLSGSLEPSALQRAFDELVRRHESLRTTFRAEGGEPRQVIHPATAWRLPVVELDTLPPAQRQPEASRILTEEAYRPFDLSAGPLMRALLLKLEPAEYVLLVNMHHGISDGWSTGVLVRELAALYDAFRQGRASPLPELPVQYADYAVWQRHWLQGEALRAQIDWWKQLLSGAPTALELPTDKPRPATLTHAGGKVSVHLPVALSQGLEALAQREGVTPYMLLLAGFQALLHRYSGQDDVLVGSPIAGRRHAETEGIIGFFVNTLVLRARFSPQLTFRELLAQVRDTTLGAYEHQDVPFERLVEELQPKRDLSRTPLFQALFALQNAPMPELSLPGLTLRNLELDPDSTKFELSLDLTRTSDGYQGGLVFSTELFERTTAERLMAHFQLLLEKALAAPEAPLSALPLQTATERQQLLVAWNGASANFQGDACLHTLFEQQVCRTPDAPAVQFGTTVLSYALLNTRANQLAHHLRTLGVGPDVTVGLCLERTPEALIALLAVLKAGGAYVPVDPSAPAQRKSFVLQDSGASVLLTVQHLADAWQPEVRHLLLLDTDAARLAALPEHDVPSSARAENLAYVIYTSGSTGTPKGVMVQHRSVLHLHAATARSLYAGLPPGLRLSLNAPLYFDVSVEQLLHLADGHCLCLLSEDTRKDPEALLAWVQQQRIDVLDCTPAQLTPLIQAGLLEAAHVPRMVVCAGEAMDLSLWKTLSRTQRTRAVNAYGPTEATVYATSWSVRDSSVTTPVIGQPLPNTQAYVLDEGLRMAPLGVPGELYLAGEGLARGYLGRPALTAERFVPNPFSTEPGARMYRTGDKARWRADGTLEYLGRLDFQVKVRGFRIELGEVEAALRTHPAVKDVVVLAREDVPGDKRLVAYVVGAESAELAASLRTHARQHLPEYMVPSAFVPLATLPLNANGKVDRKVLPPPEASMPRNDYSEAPRTPTEQTVAELFAQLLRVSRVGAQDSFFELGGHSLLATQLASRIRAAFGTELPLRTLFEAPTVAALAERIQAATAGPRLPELTKARRDGLIPLSFAQQRLWFLDQLQPDSALYNMPVALRLTGTLELPAFQRAFDVLVQRHEVLRTTFHSEGGEPFQVIHPARDGVLQVVDLSGLPDARRQPEVMRIAMEDAQRPFHLAEGPLLRARMVKVEPAEYVLLLNMHHGISDGWSTGVLVREVVTLYEAFRRGLPSHLPELPVQYADYAVWQRDWLQGETLRAQLDWWKQQLSGAPNALELPTDKPRPATLTHAGGNVPVHLSLELSRALDARAQREGVTPYMLLLAAFQAVLHRYSGQDDVLVGSPIAGRRHAQTEDLIGFFVNTLVLRARFSPRLTFHELLAQVRDTTLGAYEHQDVPFEKLVEELQPTRDLGRTPLFQALFVLQNTPDASMALPELTIQGVEVEHTVARFELEFGLRRTSDGYQGGLVFSTELFERTTAERLMAHFQLLLEKALAAPEAPLSALPLQTATERQQLLVEWNGTSADFRRDACLHTLFEQQVRRTPNAPAVQHGDTVLTYAWLNVRANQLANHLRTLGVGPDATVGLCLERTPDAIVALLAVLKAGGAYVPIDPAAPPQRKSFVLQDSGASVLLTVQHLADAWRPEVRHLICLDGGAARFSSLPDGNLPPASSAVNLAYVIYTSGSTGTPKGVMVQHRSVLHLHATTARALYAGLPSGLRLSLNAPLYFDVSVEQLLHLADGHCLCLLSEDMRKDPEALLAWVQQQRIDVLDCTPAQLTLLLQAGLLEAPHVPQMVVCAGEAMDLSLWKALSRTQRTRAVNAYGPTEATVYATTWSVQDSSVTTPVIGQPLPNTQAYVLDEGLRMAPLGVPGELYLAGEGLARGYLGRSALTAERFVPNPFSTEPGARMYRTGDKARWRADGTLEYLGRLDFQVKVRGFRIELGEIETVLRAHPAVKDAVVLAREDVPGDKRLVAYVVTAPGATPESEELATPLRTHARQHLPEYMVPSAFVSLSALPLNANGKVDRKALPAPQALEAPASTYVAPRDSLELTLVRVWEQVLGIQPVGVRSSFFELGGHSLLAVRLMAAMRQATGRHLPLAALFQAPTVEQLAALLRREDSGTHSPLVPFGTASTSTAVPFFCVHAVGGNVLSYAELARLLGTEWPFYGLQARGLDGTTPPLGTVEEMAAEYVKAIRTVQPSGPYFLGGWSMGGVIAYEMARQLRASGEEVAKLVLIDSYVPAVSVAAQPEPDRLQLALMFARDLMGASLTELPIDLAQLAGMAPEAMLEELLRAVAISGALPPGTDTEHVRALFRVFEANLLASRRYEAKATQQRVMLFKATDDAEELPEDGGWKALVGDGLERHLLPGDHYSLLRQPTVRDLAERLREVLKSSR